MQMHNVKNKYQRLIKQTLMQHMKRKTPQTTYAQQAGYSPFAQAQITYQTSLKQWFCILVRKPEE